jgi:hypothetical protein
VVLPDLRAPTQVPARPGVVRDSTVRLRQAAAHRRPRRAHPGTLVTRHVVLIAGPPGAGKTTRARALGLPVYDRDDYPTDRAFRAALAPLQDPTAQAAVIRSCPRAADMRRWQQLIGATEVLLLKPDPTTCRQRIADSGAQPTRLAGVRSWFVAHTEDPWETVKPQVRASLPPSRAW